MRKVGGEGIGDVDAGDGREWKDHGREGGEERRRAGGVAYDARGVPGPKVIFVDAASRSGSGAVERSSSRTTGATGSRTK